MRAAGASLVHMRKRLRVVLGLVAAAVLAAPVTIAAVHVAHRRDEDGYLAYLKEYRGVGGLGVPLPGRLGATAAPAPPLRPRAGLKH